MLESQQIGHSKATNSATDADRQSSLQVRRGIRSILRQAVHLKDLAYETGMALREKFESEEEADRARARSKAVVSAIKGFETTVQDSRGTLGKPNPGSRRPLPEQPKSKKTRPTNIPPSFKPQVIQP